MRRQSLNPGELKKKTKKEASHAGKPDMRERHKRR
jgi:hypothetical protein